MSPEARERAERLAKADLAKIADSDETTDSDLSETDERTANSQEEEGSDES